MISREWPALIAGAEAGFGAILLILLARIRGLLRQSRQLAAEAVRRHKEITDPDLTGEYRKILGELASQAAMCSRAVRFRGQMLADKLRLIFAVIPDTVLATIVYEVLLVACEPVLTEEGDDVSLAAVGAAAADLSWLEPELTP